MNIAFINQYIQSAANDAAIALLTEQHQPDEETIEALFCELFANPNLSQTLVKKHIQFIEDRFKSSHLTQKKHIRTLILTIFRSRVLLEEKDNATLAVLLSIEQQIPLIFELLLLGAAAADSSTPLTKPLTYQNKLKALISALTVSVTSDDLIYQQTLADNKTLANRVMDCRLHAQNNPATIEKLIDELLIHPTRYDWDDPAFKKLALKTITSTFKTSSLESLTRRFNQFNQIVLIKESISLLDELFIAGFNKDAILHLIKSTGPQAPALCINFLTYSQINNIELKTLIFNELDSQQLISVCGHLVAQYANSAASDKILPTLYYQILCAKLIQSREPSRASSLDYLANTLACLPMDIQDNFLKEIFVQFTSHIDITLCWLKALFKVNIAKKRLFDFIAPLLKTLKPLEKQTLLSTFTYEEIQALLIYNHHQNANDIDFDGVVSLCKKTEGHLLTNYLLTYTPNTNTNFIQTVEPFLTTQELVRLLDNLFSKIQIDASYQSNFETIAQLFCNRLMTCDNKADDIHQWIYTPHASLIATQLLSDPLCLSRLISRSSTIQTYTPTFLQGGYLIKNIHQDLTLRLTQCLNIASLTQSGAIAIAYRWLSHFKTAPNFLQTIFLTFEAIKIDLNETGLHNLLAIKAASFSILQPNEPFDNEKSTQLLTLKLHDKARFDPVLIDTIEQSEDQFKSLYLSQLEGNDLQGLEPQTIAKSLVQSLQPIYQVNWEKVQTYMISQNIEIILPIITKLIQLNEVNNPSLNKKSWQWIVSLPQFSAILSRLDNNSLQWLVKTAAKETIEAIFPQWLKIISETDHEINYGELLIQLPSKLSFLDKLYQAPLLKEKLADFFVSLANQANNTDHLIAIMTVIKSTPNVIRAFLQHTLKHCEAKKLDGATAYAMTYLLLELTLNSQISEDRALVLQHIHFLTELLQNPSIQKGNTVSIQELQQLLLTLLAKLREKDSHWDKILHTEEQFSLALLKWFSLPEQPIEKHPLTAILLENKIGNTHPNLIQAPAYQSFVCQLLLTPPSELSNSQFRLLFNTLTKTNQSQLADTILRQTNLTNVQISSLFTLSESLSITTLFDHFKHSKTKFIFVDLIFRHPETGRVLSIEQRHELLSYIKVSADLLRILDSYCPMKNKCALITALFEDIEAHQEKVSERLSSLFLDGPTLAALANFTTRPVDIQKLDEWFNSNPYHKEKCHHYLQAPSLDLPINPDGYLFQLIQTHLLNPWLGVLVHPSFFSTLLPNQAQIAIHHQIDCLRDLSSLENSLTPLSGHYDAAKEMLICCRFIHRLGLLSNGLLAIWQTLNTASNEAVTDTIQHTELFNQLINPLQMTQSSLSIDVIMNRLYALLKDYYEVFPKTLLPDHLHAIKTALSHYESSLAILEKFSSPSLWELLNPDSFIAKLKQKQCTLQDIDVKAVINAPILHHEALEKNRINPREQIKVLFTTLASQHPLLKNNELKQMVFTQLIRMPFIDCLNSETLQQLIQYVSPQELLHYAQQFNKKFTTIHTTIAPIQHQFREINAQNISECLEDLLKQPIDTLHLWLATAKFFHLSTLTHILQLALQCNHLNLTKSAKIALLLPRSLSANNELDWLSQDLQYLFNHASMPQERYHQLITLSLLYQNDEWKEARINALTAQALLVITPLQLSQILTSYHSLFNNDQNTTLQPIFIKTLTLLLEQQKDSRQILQCIPETFRNKIIQYATLHIKDCFSLLNALISFDNPDNISALLTTRWIQFTKPQQEIPPSITSLPDETLKTLNDETYHEIMLIERLLYACHPLESLASQSPELTHNNPIAFTAFLSEASFFHHLTTSTHNLSKETLSRHLQWLLNYGLIETYSNMAYAYEKEAYAKHKNFLAHWLKLYYFFASRKTDAPPEACNHLANTIVNIIEAHSNVVSLQQDITLTTLLHFMIEIDAQKALSDAMHLMLSPTKIHWVLVQLTQTMTVTKTHLKYFVPHCSLDELLSDIQSLANPYPLLQALLESSNHQKTLQETPVAQLRFLETLNKAALEINQLIIIMKALEPAPLSQQLIALSLLSRQDYLNALPGPSCIELIAKNHPLACPRLIALTQRINLPTLSAHMLHNLSTETGISLLMTVSIFHQLTIDNLRAILSIKKLDKEKILDYWLKHFIKAPNAEIPLLNLINLERELIFKLLKQDETLYEAVLSQLIRYSDQLEVFSTTEAEQLAVLCNESHLVEALTLFLEGVQKSPSAALILSALINNVALKESLQTHTIQLLIELSEKPQFYFIAHHIHRLTGNYLHAHAESGDVSLFYHQDNINKQRIQKILTKKVDSLLQDEPQRLFTLLAGKWKKIANPDAYSSARQPLHIDDLKMLTETYKQPIRNIDYFLIHFKGNKAALTKTKGLIKDYMTQLKNHSWEALHSTSTLLALPHVHPNIKECLYNNLLIIPACFENPVCAHLVNYKPQETLRYYGKKGHFGELIHLCTEALKSPIIKNNSHVQKILRTALKEAQLEQSISQFSQHFLNFRTNFWRCWQYGWTGWFRPNLPQFVSYYQRGTLVEPFKIETPTQKINRSFEEKFDHLLTRTTAQSHLLQLGSFYAKLIKFNRQTKTPASIEMLEKIDALYDSLWQTPGKITWLEAHRNAFMNNRHGLIEQYLIHNEKQKLTTLIMKPNHDANLKCWMSHLKLNDPILVPQATPSRSSYLPVASLSNIIGSLFYKKPISAPINSPFALNQQ